MTEDDRVSPTPPPRFCVVNERGEYFTARLMGAVVEPSWTPFPAWAYTYPDETEASEIASRYGGAVRPYAAPGDTAPRGGVVVPFVRPGRR